MRRLGFPDASHHKALVLGLAIDALGSGVFMPASIVYFLVTTDVGTAGVGLALSVAASPTSAGVTPPSKPAAANW